mgnify:CR=1 FL=1
MEHYCCTVCNLRDIKTVHLSVNLQEFVNKCKAEEVTLTQGLTKLYYLNLDTFISLLREMIQFENFESHKAPEMLE